MKATVEKSSVDLDGENVALDVVESPRECMNAVSQSPNCTARERRPEIAVLGWNIRSYRLALRRAKV